MPFIEAVLEVLSAAPPVTLAVGGLGLFLTLASVWLFRRRRRQGYLTRSRLGVMLVSLCFGLILCTLAGTVIARWPPAMRLLFAPDFANPTIMDAAKLEALSPGTESLPDEWPQWRGPRRDGVSPAAGLNLDWKNTPPRVLWRKPIGGGFSSIAVNSDRLYTQDKQGDQERVVCLDRESGKEIWTHAYPVSYKAFHRGYDQGPRATPTVYDGRVYAVGATGRFFCLEANPTDGKARVHWEHDLMTEFNAPMPPWGVACSPLIDGDRVIVQPGGEKGSVAAFDRHNGALVWKALDGEISGYSSPVLTLAAGVRQVIALTGHGLAGLRAEDGQELWYQEWKTAFDANIATPIVAGDYVFISSDYNMGCALFKLTRTETGVSAEPVYIKHNKTMRNHHSTCVLHESFLYGVDSRDSLGKRTVIRCVDFRTGEEKWATDDMPKAAPILVEGHLLLLFEDGDMVLSPATPGGFREKGRLSVFRDASEAWALPALAGGRLYLRSHREIACVDLNR